MQTTKQNNSSNVIKIAITGNIASGKSQVEKLLSKDFPVYDCDKIAHEVLENITDFYGLDVFTNNKIDRKKLGSLVFSNPDLKSKLESIVHPKVKTEILKIFEKHSEDDLVFISIPLLFEVNFENLFDKIIFVSAPENIRLKRLMVRNNLAEDEAIKRIKSQLPEEEKIKKSDYIITNNSSVDELEKQVLILVREFHSLVNFKNAQAEE